MNTPTHEGTVPADRRRIGQDAPVRQALTAEPAISVRILPEGCPKCFGDLYSEVYYSERPGVGYVIEWACENKQCGYRKSI